MRTRAHMTSAAGLRQGMELSAGDRRDQHGPVRAAERSILHGAEAPATGEAAQRDDGSYKNTGEEGKQ